MYLGTDATLCDLLSNVTKHPARTSRSLNRRFVFVFPPIAIITYLCVMCIHNDIEKKKQHNLSIFFTLRLIVCVTLFVRDKRSQNRQANRTSYVPFSTFHNAVDDLVVFACVCVAKQLGILCQSSARVLKWRRSSPRYCMHSRIGIDYNGPEAPRPHDLLSFCAAHAPRLRFATTRSNKHTHARDYGSPIR